MAPFSRILIANRGEIACRIIATCRRLGIETVAVFSEADAGARHVRLADQAIHLGPPPASESYLCGDRVIEAALRSGAQAVHPGYGFLSENADFAEACERAGLVFIGPPTAAIRAMGDKSAAKALMERAGVAVVPGYHGDDQRPEFLRQQAARIGYPLLIKASAGGGGKGMRVVEDDAQFLERLASCQREAAAGFGNDQVLLERYLQQPRHIEIQVFGDRHGNVLHLFERDCSLQRRHQKVIEEAPAPGMTPVLREQMGAAAIVAARAVDYVGAGTVEFIVDASGEFFFMEMNTRLQVEHPVTELITGLDLVEWQLRVAAGEALPLQQSQLQVHGHAIEARLYAEDADNGFLPSIGQLHLLVQPPGSPQVRIDTGVEQGDEITPFYDPMICKLIVWGEGRDAALQQLQEALRNYHVAGVSSNVAFLGRLAALPAFVAGRYDTGIIEREWEALAARITPVPDLFWLIAVLAQLLSPGGGAGETADVESPWAVRDGWRLNGRHRTAVRLRHRDAEGSIEVEYVPAGGYQLGWQGQTFLVDGEWRADGYLRARIDGHASTAIVAMHGQTLHIVHQGRSETFSFIDPLAGTRADDEHHAGLLAPMPGRIVALLAGAGASVGKGDPLLVMEAMKMEHTVTAPVDGVVAAFLCAVGDQVPQGAALIDFTEAG
jgi:3-methylcrotonyl-CoA carboxylase alpha subunit